LPGGGTGGKVYRLQLHLVLQWLCAIIRNKWLLGFDIAAKQFTFFNITPRMATYGLSFAPEFSLPVAVADVIVMDLKCGEILNLLFNDHIA